MPRYLGGLLIVAMLVSPVLAQNADIVLNEWNAVGGSEFLKDSSTDTHFGRVLGNGGNWIELVVTDDHADIRGWELRWWEDDGDGNGSSVWDPTRVAAAESQGTIAFSDAAIWSDLRAGTIITISEDQILNTEYDGGAPATFDLSTNTSYNPLGGDFDIHISSLDEADEISPLLTTITNIDGDPAGAFSVGKKDWELTVFDGAANHFGPIGEGWGSFGGIGGDEVGKLEADPSAAVTIDDYNDGTSSTFGAPNMWSSGSVVQDFSALRAQVPEPASLALLALGALWTARRRR